MKNAFFVGMVVAACISAAVAMELQQASLVPKAMVSSRSLVDIVACDPSNPVVSLDIYDYASITTPNFPDNWNQQATCGWTLQSIPGTQIEIFCPYMHVLGNDQIIASDGVSTWTVYGIHRNQKVQFSGNQGTFIFVKNRQWRASRGATCTVTVVSPENTCNCGEPVTSSALARLYGSVSSATAGEFKWMAQFYETRTSAYPFCAGSLINDNYIVVPASCYPTGSETYEILLGNTATDANNAVAGSLWVTQQRVVIHENFNAQTLSNNIAVVQMANGIEWIRHPNIRPVCTPTGTDDFGDDPAVVVGWGVTSTAADATRPADLQKMTSAILTSADCDSAFGTAIVPSQLCVSTDAEQQATCLGDVGSSAVVLKDGAYELAAFAIISDCTSPHVLNVPMLMVRVAEFADWLATNAPATRVCPKA